MPYSNYLRWKQHPNVEEPILSVVVPAYNEADRIIPTIGAISSHISDMNCSWELIVVDDGSTDNTAALVKALGLANLRLLSAGRNVGKGSAVRRGMLAARGQYVLFTDADNSTPIEEIGKLLAPLMQSEAQVAIGSRAAAGAAEMHRTMPRRLISRGLRWLVRYMLQLRIRDTQCGFKLYTRGAARRLHSLQTLTGFSFDLELLFLARKFGLEVLEIPVTWIEAPGSKVDPIKEIGRFLHDLLRIRLSEWRGAYEG